MRASARQVGQAPDARRRELDAVAGRVADIERAAATRPGLLVLDRARRAGRKPACQPSSSLSATAKQACPAPMAPCGGTSRLRRAAVGVEQQQHAGPTRKKQNSAGLAAVERQAQHVAVEPLRRVEIVSVEHGLEHAGDRGHACSRSRRMPAHQAVHGTGTARPTIVRDRAARGDRHVRTRHGARGRAFADHLVDGYRAVYGKRDPDHGSTIRAMAQLAVERISSSDALYHDVHHTMLVTLVGQTILRGRIMVEEVTPEDWLHFTVATLCHDIGYLRGICPGDRDGRYVIDAQGHHDRGAARCVGRVPRALPYRARQDLRPPPLHA